MFHSWSFRKVYIDTIEFNLGHMLGLRTVADLCAFADSHNADHER